MKMRAMRPRVAPARALTRADARTRRDAHRGRVARRADASNDALDAARAIDASIDALRDVTRESVESMLRSDASVVAEMERARSDARSVAEREVARAEASERLRVKEVFEVTQRKTEAVQSKAVMAAEEAVSLKRDAVAQAEARVAAAAAARDALAAELAREDAAGSKWADDTIDETAEKMESGKAAAIAGAGGAALATPLVLSQGGDVVSLGFVALSCAVFGVTYRYAVRRDLGNNELKGGVVGAFGLARGLSAADVYLRAASLAGDVEVATYAQAALLAGQGVLTYAFAAVALEQAFARGFLKPFGAASEEAE